MRRLLPIMVALLLAQAAAAQSNIDANGDRAGVQAVLDRFLSLNAVSQLASPEGQALMAGELAEARRPTVGALPAPDRLLLLSDGRAVARFPARGEDRPDIYVYLRRNEGGAWTINAYRALALPRFMTDLRNGLRAITVRSEEDEATLANVELTMRSDAELRRWFEENRPALDRLRALGRPDPRSAEVQAQLAALHALTLDLSPAGVTTVTIGGVLDNGLGFLHAADPAAVPPVGPEEYIWIEPVGDGWYLFKTT